MQTLLPPWRHDVPRDFKPVGKVLLPKLAPYEYLDLIALERSRLQQQRQDSVRCSGTTGTWAEQMFVNTADYSAFNTSAAEGSLLGGVNDQPVIPALFFFNKQGRNRCVRLEASGVMGTTSTPTIIFQVRLGTTSGSSFLSGASVGVSAAITTASGVSNQWWQLVLDLQCNVAGIGSGNSTLSCAGYVMSPGAFASPFVYPLTPTTPPTATWTATFDNSVTQYVNASVTWGTSSSSNTITAKRVALYGWN